MHTKRFVSRFPPVIVPVFIGAQNYHSAFLTGTSLSGIIFKEDDFNDNNGLLIEDIGHPIDAIMLSQM